MAKIPTRHARDQAVELEGLLNNLQDWELLKDKDKKLRSESTSKNLGLAAQRHSMDSASQHSNGKHPMKKTPSDNRGRVKNFDYLKNYDPISHLSGGLDSEESAIDANSEKELGNEFFKQKKYNKAIDCYSRSIALSPTAVAYANRAMAYIKIKRFAEAENDCSEALNLDDRYIKAYSRRSTARKELGKLKEAIDDAGFALRLEPQNEEIKKQLSEAKSLLEKGILKKASGERAGKSTVEPNKSKPGIRSVSTSSTARRVAEILEEHVKDDNKVVLPDTSMEVDTSSLRTNGSAADSESGNGKREQKNGKQELKTSVQDLAARAANLAKAEVAKNIVPPNSAYQFEASWKGFSGDQDLQARLLKITAPTALARIFKNALTASILMDIIRCISTFFMEDMDLGVKHLENLTKVPRFDMIIMCLSPADKAELSKLWDEVFGKVTGEYAEILGSMRSRYGVK